MSIDAGMDDHLTKPINAFDMLAVLARLVQQHREPSEDAARINALSTAMKGPEMTLPHGINSASALGRIDGNLDLYIKILKIYKNNIPAPEAIVEHFRQGDSDTARREAHTAKGMSAQIGAEGLQEIAAGLEAAIKAGDSAAVEQHAALFAAELKKVLLTVDQFVHCSDQHPN